MADYAHLRFRGVRIDGQPTEEEGTTDTVPTTSRPAAAGSTQYYDRVAGSRIFVTGGTLVGHVFVFDGAGDWTGQLNVESTFSDAADQHDNTTATVAAPAADAPAGVHAAYATGVNVNFPGPFTSPVVPRNVSVTYSGGYDGGNTTIVGTDMADGALSETIVVSLGATVYGTKVFKTVASATQAALGGGGQTASIGWGHKLGVAVAPAVKAGLCTFGGVPDPAAFDNTAQSYGFTPTNLPDGATDYVVEYPRVGLTTTVTPTL